MRFTASFAAPRPSACYPLELGLRILWLPTLLPWAQTSCKAGGPLHLTSLATLCKISRTGAALSLPSPRRPPRAGPGTCVSCGVGFVVTVFPASDNSLLASPGVGHQAAGQCRASARRGFWVKQARPVGLQTSRPHGSVRGVSFLLSARPAAGSRCPPWGTQGKRQPPGGTSTGGREEETCVCRPHAAVPAQAAPVAPPGCRPPCASPPPDRTGFRGRHRV